MTGGVSTSCFYPVYTERALEWLVQNGVKEAEIFFNAPSELEEPFLKAMAKTAKAGGTKIVSLHPFTSNIEPLLLFSAYRRRVEDGIEWYKRWYFHAANVLGARLVVIHGDHKGSRNPPEQYFDMFGELALAGEKMGVIVAQENVPRCISWEPAFFKQMHAYLPKARFVLDTKQALRAGFSPEEMAQAMGGGIGHVHISDYDSQRDCIPLGQGDMDALGLLRQLKDQGFNGSVLLEVYRWSFDDPSELLESYQVIEKLISQVTAR